MNYQQEDFVEGLDGVAVTYAKFISDILCECHNSQDDSDLNQCGPFTDHGEEVDLALSLEEKGLMLFNSINRGKFERTSSELVLERTDVIMKKWNEDKYNHNSIELFEELVIVLQDYITFAC